MDIFTIVFWIVAIILTVFSLVKDKKKTFAAMKKSKGMMGSMLGEIIAIIFLIGLVLTFIPPENDSGSFRVGKHLCVHSRFGACGEHHPNPGVCRLSFGGVVGECWGQYYSSRRVPHNAHNGRGCYFPA